MTTTTHDLIGRRLRIAAWTGAVALLALPFVAMQFTREVQWTASDFLLFGVVLAIAGGAFDRLTRIASGWPYRIGAALAVGTGFLLVWVTLAVQIIGDGHPANLLYGVVLAIPAVGAVLARARTGGMARACAIAAVAQVAIGTTAWLAGWGVDAPVFPRDVIGATGVFAALWLAAAGAFAWSASNGD